MTSGTATPRRTSTIGSFARRLAAMTALVGMTMCNLTHIEVDVGGKGTIPKATVLDTLLGDLSFAGFDKIDFSQDFQNQGVTKDEVNTVKLKSFTLTIDAPSGQTFDFLTSIAFFAEADGEPMLQIASMDSVPKGKTELTLILNADADLTPYVVAPSMSITSQIQGMKPANDTDITASVALDVDVHIPGCN